MNPPSLCSTFTISAFVINSSLSIPHILSLIISPLNVSHLSPPPFVYLCPLSPFIVSSCFSLHCQSLDFFHFLTLFLIISHYHVLPSLSFLVHHQLSPHLLSLYIINIPVTVSTHPVSPSSLTHQVSPAITTASVRQNITKTDECCSLVPQ